MRGLLLLAAVAVATALPIVPAAAQAQQAPSDVRSRMGLELATLLNSEALTKRQLDKMISETLPKTLAADPNFQALETAYPGISKDVIAAMAPILIDETLKQLPSLWQTLAPIYASEFEETDLRALLAFYRSPLGTKIIQVMGESSDFSQLLKESISTGGSNISEQGLRAGLAEGTAAVQQQVTPQERVELIKFGISPAGQKLRATLPKIQTASVAWGNTSNKSADQRVEKAVTAVVERYVGQKVTQ